MVYWRQNDSLKSEQSFVSAPLITKINNGRSYLLSHNRANELIMYAVWPVFHYLSRNCFPFDVAIETACWVMSSKAEVFPCARKFVHRIFCRCSRPLDDVKWSALQFCGRKKPLKTNFHFRYYYCFFYFLLFLNPHRGRHFNSMIPWTQVKSIITGKNWEIIERLSFANRRLSRCRRRVHFLPISSPC